MIQIRDTVDLSIVILSWETRNLTVSCLNSIENSKDDKYSFEIIVVDNASTDGSAVYIEKYFPHVKLIQNKENRLYAEGNNQGVRIAKGRYICLLNSDTEIQPGSITTLVDFLETNVDYSAVSPQLLNTDLSIQHNCSRFPTLLSPLVDSTILRITQLGKNVKCRNRMTDFDHSVSRDVDQPSFACIILRGDDFRVIDGFDPKLSLFYNDVDLCFRLIRSGRKIRFLSTANVIHHGGASTSILKTTNPMWFVNREYYFHKHYGFTGLAWLKLIHYLWASEVFVGTLLGPRNFSEKRQGLLDLYTHFSKCRTIKRSLRYRK